MRSTPFLMPTMSAKEEHNMSSTKLSTSTSEATATPGPIETDSSSSAHPMVVKVSLVTMKKQLAGYRKSLVKRRRNELAAAARARKDGVTDQSGQAAANTLIFIRMVDAQLGLLNDSLNERSSQFAVDLRDPSLIYLGFGMDENGNYPAL